MGTTPLTIGLLGATVGIGLFSVAMAVLAAYAQLRRIADVLEAVTKDDVRPEDDQAGLGGWR